MSYNEVLDLMQKDGFIPFYETVYKEIYVGYGIDYGLSDQLSDIIDEFARTNGDCVVTS